MNLTSEFLFRLAAAVVFFGALFISLAYRLKARRAQRRADVVNRSGSLSGGRGLALVRVATAVVALSIPAYAINPAWVVWGRLALPVWLRWLGVASGLLLLPALLATLRALGENITPTAATRPDHSLVTTGPYRWVRHPLYVVGVGLWLALALVMANVIPALFGLLGVIFVAVRVPSEEANLIAHFGEDYRAYMRRTGRFWPRLSR